MASAQVELTIIDKVFLPNFIKVILFQAERLLVIF